MTQMSETERTAHETMDRNALGTYIGCTGEHCTAVFEQIIRDNAGHKIQGV